MKKIFLFAIALTAITLTQAQVFFFDNFSNNALPNWTKTNFNTGTSNVNWEWSNTAATTGTYAGTFGYAGATNGHVRVDSDGDGATGVAENTVLTSKVIDCTGKPVVLLGFYEYYRKFQSDTPRVQISSDSVTWTPVYSPIVGLATNDATTNPKFVEVNISAIAANQATVYIRFAWKGKFDYWWMIDDVSLRVPSAIEANATGLLNRLSNGCTLTSTEEIKLVIHNRGLQNITTFNASYRVGTGTVVTETVTPSSPIPYDSSYTHTFTATANLSAAALYNITGWVSLAGDTVLSNDTTGNIAVSVVPFNLTAPYTMGFEVPNAGTEIGGLAWTNDDANQDDFSWFLTAASPNTGLVHYRYFYNVDATTAANDWLFSPCLQMTANVAYKISFFTEVGDDGNGNAYPEKLELKIGNAPATASMTTPITDFGTLTNIAYEEKKAAYKPTTSGTYHLGLHAYSDADDFFLDIDDVNISILPLPNAQFATNQAGLTVGVVDGSDDMITTWNWNWGDGSAASTGQTPAAHTYTTAGTYTICLIVNNLAGADTLCKTLTISGIENLNDVSDLISVYPNPTQGLLNVALPEIITGESKIDIVNMIGETLITRVSAGNKIEKFNMADLPQGLYYVNVTAEGTKAVKKFFYAK